ncbi:MAG: hypothetical protein WC359_15580 [Dehalococcoidia bacterium]|jgi:hypothetical protein
MRRAQALLEIAIFGAIIVMLLGVLITYGIRYNAQQKLMQQSFRKALSKSVSQPGVAVSNVILRDTHIPNPSDTFGVGSVTPFIGSGGTVTRDYQMGETATESSELPSIVVDINGQEYTYKTAGFRDEPNVPEDSLDRYDQVYGWGNVWETSDGACAEEGTEIDPNTGETNTTCTQATKNIRIIDSCSGDIFDYGSAVKQCRMIVDSEACAKECNRASDPAVNCSSVCSQPMNVPWYCETAECGLNPCNLGAAHIYTFTKLNQIFNGLNLKSLGLQQDYQQRTTADNSMRKTEDASGITTADNVNWSTAITRKIITHPSGSTSPATTTKEVSSVVSQNKEESRRTNW